jgi:hypothetical protein
MTKVQKLLHPATADMPVDVDFLATRVPLMSILPQFSGKFDHCYRLLGARTLPHSSSDISGMNGGQEDYDPAGTKDRRFIDRRR